MRKTAEVQIETSRGLAAVTLQQVGGRSGAALFVRLAAIIGPNAASLQKLDMAILGVLKQEDFDYVRSELLRGALVKVSGEALTLDENAIDDLFAGHVGSLLKLLFEALKLNFSSLFVDAGLHLSKVK